LVVSCLLDLWLIRHGVTAWNLAGRLTGWADVGLSPAGREQARRLRLTLDRIGPALAWSSDLRRATETARLAGLEPRTDRRLREIHFGALEGRTWKELDERVRSRILRFDGFHPPGGESVDALRRRVLGFLEELTPGRHIVVSHGGPLKVMLRLAGCSQEMFPGGVLRLEWPWEG
jgi:2,3-bisphosphoglycerate-dependent phosphoglycerate mutase